MKVKTIHSEGVVSPLDNRKATKVILHNGFLQVFNGDMNIASYNLELCFGEGTTLTLEIGDD